MKSPMKTVRQTDTSKEGNSERSKEWRKKTTKYTRKNEKLISISQSRK
jgi:hypothetical protein